MAEINSKFTREDVETLLQSIDDWEAIGNQEFHLMNMVRNVPMPAEDSETYNMLSQLKTHFAQREKDIQAARKVVREKAVFLRAKLMLSLQDMEVNNFFQMATETEAVETPQEPVENEISTRKLDAAEHFIRDLGVWEHYVKFLAEQEKK